MDRDKDLLKWQWPFFLSIFAVNFVGIMAVAYYGKDELHLYFNHNYNFKIFDVFFRYYTDIATTWLLVLLLVYAVWKKTWRDFLFLTIIPIASSIGSALIKRGLFIHGHRPTYYFELKGIPLKLAKGVESQIPYTFPSGHTVLVVILCFYLCIQTKNRVLQFIFCFLMALVAVGRVYLSKHFVIDTVGGSMLGLFFTLVGYYCIWHNQRPFLSRKIIP